MVMQNKKFIAESNAEIEEKLKEMNERNKENIGNLVRNYDFSV